MTAKTMRAARLYEGGKPMVIEQVSVPEIRPTEVLVKVKACGIVPNLHNILTNWVKWFPQNPLPKLPAVFGLDPSGVVEAVGAQVYDFKVGDRVYVNPIRSCNTCRHCIDGDYIACAHYTFAGYFGFSQKSKEIYKRFPSGGYAEYMQAPVYSVVKIPDKMTYDEAARLGYVGTAYGALRRANVGPETVVLINGASGTLGLGAVQCALALGARRILGVARNRALLAQVKAIAPERVEVWSTEDGPIANWVRDLTDGEGVDVAIDCLPFGSSPDLLLSALNLVRRCGVMINVGGVVGNVPLPLADMMTKGITFLSSNWFTPKHAREMAALVDSGTLDLSALEHQAFPLEEFHGALSTFAKRHGGFTNVVIHP